MGAWSNLLKRPYKWTLSEDYFIRIPDEYPLPDFQNEWVTIVNNYMKVHSQYSWDGASFKRIIFGKLVGIWDGLVIESTGKQQLYYPTLIHDILTQFRIGRRKTADQIFYWMMEDVGFKFKKLYYRAVRIFGKLFANY